MNRFHIYFGVGAILILMGILVSSSTLIGSLRTVPPHLAEQLLAGATLLRIGFVILGLLIIVLERMIVGASEIHSSQSCSESEPKIRNLTALVLILFAALALRLYELDAGLWYDEIVTYVKFARMPVGELISTYDTQNQNFLYSLLVRHLFPSLWRACLEPPYSSRHVWRVEHMGHVFFRTSSHGTREALLAAALLTMSYHHIWFSQNARGYTGLLFWTLLASGLFLRAQREGRPQLWLAYAASSALGVYTHMTMVFVLISHLTAYLTTLFTKRNEICVDRWTGLFLGFGVTTLFILLLHALVLPQILSTVVGQESTVPAWKNPLWTLVEFSQGVSVGFLHGAGAVIALGIFSVGLWNFGRANGVFLQFLLIPPLLCAAVNMALGHHLWPRFFFFSFGFTALIVVHGTMLLGQMMSRFVKFGSDKSVALGTILCAGLILVSALSVRSAYAPKQDFKGALDFVVLSKQPGDAVITVGLATFTYQNLYKVDWNSVESMESLNAIRDDANRTWLIYTFPTHVAAVYPDIMATIKDDFEIVKGSPGTVGDGTVFVFRSNGRRS